MYTDLPNMFTISTSLFQYVESVKRYRNGDKVDNTDYGILGSTGLYSGAFLSSPFATGDPDIQLTFFPQVFQGLY